VNNPQLSPHFYAVIPAGGVGSRLWPLSQPEAPKFLHDLTAVGSSLLQQTWSRLAVFLPPERIAVVTGEQHASAVSEQLPRLPESRLWLEPSPRDSTAAIALAAALLLREDPEAIVGSFAADHLIQDETAFALAVAEASKLAEAGLIATIGITPGFASTAFGYVEAGEAVAGFNTALHVRSFVEKPSVERALNFFETKNYFWNAGMFVVKASVLLEQLTETVAELVESALKLADAWHTEQRTATFEMLWPNIQKIAIDYSLAEPAAAAGLVAVVPADFAWRDLGDWQSVSEELGGGQKLAVVGDAPVLAIDASGLVLSTEQRAVTVIGLKDVIVIDTAAGLLVTTSSNAQAVKQVSDLLNKPKLSEQEAE
jgi:mannose-1-phosphate guanylyltransferase